MNVTVKSGLYSYCCVCLDAFLDSDECFRFLHLKDQSLRLKWNLKNERIAVNGFPSHSYVTSLAIWDHTVLPATRHK